MLTADDLELIAAVAQSGGPRRAAQVMGAHPATVYRRLAALDARLGAPVFERDGGRYRPTELGREIVEAAEAARLRLAELNRRLSGAAEAMAGWIAVTTTDSLAPFVGPLVADFQARWPQVRVALSLSNDFADMGRHEAEVAIRPTRTPPETLVGRRAATFGYSIYARPGAPERWIVLDDSLAGIPAARWLAERGAPADTACRVNSMWAASLACAAGVGRAVLPSYLGALQGLPPVGPPIPELASEVWLLTHEDMRRTPRIRALIAAAADHLARVIA